MTASFVQPGSEGRQVLEIINLSPNPIKLKSGKKIVQLILEYTDGKGKLTGFSRNQVL
jgi:deoxycytidine triphosphate deaminase